MSVTLRGAEIEAKSLGFRYHGAPAPSLVDVNFHLAAGESLLVVGPSGSGKSTLVKLLAGVIDLSEDGELTGELQVGSQLADAPPVAVGVVLQQPDDQTILHTIGDDVAFGLENMAVPRDQMDQRIHDALHNVGLTLALDHPTDALSGGQKQRLALAGALAMHPQLIILDEPLQALDPEGKAQVLEAIAEVKANTGVSLIVIDHEPAPWRHLVDRVVRITSSGSEGPWPTDAAPVVWREPVSKPAGYLASDSPVVLACEKLTLRRGTQLLPGEHTLAVRAGEIVALTGPNGAGKTSLALTLAGLLPPASGHVVKPADPHLLASPELSRHVAFVPQNPDHHHVVATVEGDLRVTPRARGLRDEDVQEPIDAAMARYQLGHLRDRHPASLSGGEARRLAIAGATITNAPVLILDEPSQSLDREARNTLVADLLERARAGVAVLIVTHDQYLVDALGAREYRLGAGVVDRHSVGPQPAAWLGRANPLALLGSALAVGVGLLASLDVVSASTALLLIMVLLVGSRSVSIRSLVRLVPVAVAAIFAAITISLYGETSGEIWWEWGIARISEGSLELGIATLLRILAIAVPAVVLFTGVEATRLADALVHQLRLPTRFVIGALAAMRLVQVLGRDYQQLQLTRRSRGVGGRSLWRRIMPDTLGMLIIALRRAQTLAIAMECRGFGRFASRTSYRESPWRITDTGIVGLGVAVAAVSLTAAVWAGTWSP